ncbi:MAG: hypothetical protein J2O48_02700 [Solirubrobacterales bacterium]|nr:hypothetical protein [Solirubrobacterales bacterium]
MRAIQQDGPGTSEADLDALVFEFERRVPHPRASALIDWPATDPEAKARLAGRKDLTPEEIVELALAYKPIQL